MSNFETEYKKYSQESTPDLWSRIEAGVDAYEAMANENKNKEDSESSKIVSFNDAKTNDSKKTSGKKVLFSKYIGVIAAAACLLIAVPAIILMKDASSNNAGVATEPMAESAAEAAEPSFADADSYSEAPAAPMVADAEEASDDSPIEFTFEESPSDKNTGTVKSSDKIVIDREDNTASTVAEYEDSFGDTDYYFVLNHPIRAMWDSEAEPSDNEAIVIDDNIPDSKIRFFFDEDVKDFTVWTVDISGYTENCNMRDFSTKEREFGSYSSGDEITLKMSFPGDSPHYAISFKDQDGAEHFAVVSSSGRDGSIILTPY